MLKKITFDLQTLARKFKIKDKEFELFKKKYKK